VRAYVGDLLAGRETARAVTFSERLGTLVEDAAASEPVSGIAINAAANMAAR